MYDYYDTIITTFTFTKSDQTKNSYCEGKQGLGKQSPASATPATPHTNINGSEEKPTGAEMLQSE